MNPLSQKAHDISFAVFRVATLIKNTKLRREIEDAATDLISKYEDSANPSIKYHIADPIDRLDRLVAIAESIKEMKPINAQVLRRELSNLQTAVLQGDTNLSKDKEEDIDISSMFPLSGNTIPSGISVSASELASGLPTNPFLNGNTAELTSRQTAILAIIREIQFCRLRNIMEKMPTVSERTIRNDIQALISNGNVQRIGNGGPASYFHTLEITARS